MALRNGRAAMVAGRRFASSLRSINPYTKEVAWEVERWGVPQALDGVARVDRAFKKWRKSSLDDRAALLRACSDILRENADPYAAVIAAEMGKPVAQGKAEVLKCATVTDYYADNITSFLADEAVSAGFARSYVTKQPLGAVLLLMPWNFPFWQVFRQASAALSVGNVILCKHAPNVPKCAELIEDVFTKATKKIAFGSESEPIYVNLPMGVEDLGPVMEHRSVRAISLTGSSLAGMKVGGAAGKLLKPSVLELGGNDPSIILEDADIALAAKQCAAGRMLNAGQSCIGSKRFLVHEAVHDEFIDAFATELQKYTIGNPLDQDTKLGTLVDHRARDQLHKQAAETIAQGAKVALDGGIPSGEVGAFYEPTILVDVPLSSPGFRAELFGPVASCVKVKSEAEAIDLANDTVYGLGASVYTQDLDRANRIAKEELDAGMCYINDFVKSHPALPFGGVKESGFGRECSSYGILTFCNLKSVVQA